MPGVGNRNCAVLPDARHTAGGEAALKSGPPVRGSARRGLLGNGIRHGPQRADDGRYRHGCAQSLAADVANDDEDAAVFESGTMRKKSPPTCLAGT